MNKKLPVLWLRAESKAFEQRSLLTPHTASQLLAHGYEVVVERCRQRIFNDNEFESMGCRMVDSCSWKEAPQSTIVLGLKELELLDGPFTRRHVHFAHVFKEQQGWQSMLKQFTRAGGVLYDLEYLTDENDKRIAAFGYWAGFVGAAVAVMVWCARQHGADLIQLESWPDRRSLLEDVNSSLMSVDHAPHSVVIGALGRCGSGATELLEACALPVSKWDLAQTSEGGPFDALRDHDILINCVLIDSEMPPFTTIEHLRQPNRRLQVISDVSCDPFGRYNPLPVYSQCTTMDAPVSTLLKASGTNPSLDLVAIDHLPSLLPRESSEDFSLQLLPALLKIDHLNKGPWKRAYDVFKKHTALF